VEKTSERRVKKRARSKSTETKNGAQILTGAALSWVASSRLLGGMAKENKDAMKKKAKAKEGRKEGSEGCQKTKRPSMSLSLFLSVQFSKAQRYLPLCRGRGRRRRVPGISPFVWLKKRRRRGGGEEGEEAGKGGNEVEL